jgi:hypothetical protein
LYSIYSCENFYKTEISRLTINFNRQRVTVTAHLGLQLVTFRQLLLNVCGEGGEQTDKPRKPLNAY